MPIVTVKTPKEVIKAYFHEEARGMFLSLALLNAGGIPGNNKLIQSGVLKFRKRRKTNKRRSKNGR